MTAKPRGPGRPLDHPSGAKVGRMIPLSPAHYEYLTAYAEFRGVTRAALVAQMIEAIIPPRDPPGGLEAAWRRLHHPERTS